MLTDKQYLDLAFYVKKNLGIDLGTNKKNLVDSRLKSVFLKYNITNFNDFYRKLTVENDSEMHTALTNAITTNYTYFMREVDHFKFFENTVMPNLKKTNSMKDLRIWCAACSSGEEAYTLAMIIDDVLGDEKDKWDRKLLATDISEAMLQICQRGVYPLSALSSLPKKWSDKYVKPINSTDGMMIPEIKNQVLFRRFNLIDNNYAFKKKFSVIFCRNVMIYFDVETRKKIIQHFYDLLEPGGYLFIGHSETVEKGWSKFKYVMPAVYRKE